MLGPTQPLADYSDTSVSVVVAVTWAGRVWYLSDRSISGDVDIIPGLLEVPGVDDEFSTDSLDAGITVPLGLVLPIVVADYVDAGHDLADMVCEVSWVWHRRGVMAHPWSARDVRAEGDLDEPQHTDPTMPGGWVGASLVDTPYRVERPIVRRTWKVDATTWPSAPEESLGTNYPLALGAPDPNSDGGGPPAVVIDVTAGAADTVLVSVGWCHASEVSIVDVDGVAVVLPIKYQLDGAGQMCAIVDVSGSGGTIDLTGALTSAWTEGPALRPFGSVSPVAVAAYLLTLSGADIDLPEWIRVAALLGQAVGGYVDDPDTRGWEVARDMMAGLPVRSVRSRNGWASVLIDPHLYRSMSIGTWDDSAHRASSPWQAEGASRVTLVEVTSDASDTEIGATSARDAGLPHAWARHLPRQSGSSQSPSWSWSVTLDRRMVGWAARAGALGMEARVYTAPPPWAHARAGDVVYLESAGRYAQIQRRTLSGGIIDYTLIRPVGR